MHTLTWEYGLSNFTANCTEKSYFFLSKNFYSNFVTVPAASVANWPGCENVCVKAAMEMDSSARNPFEPWSTNSSGSITATLSAPCLLSE